MLPEDDAPDIPDVVPIPEALLPGPVLLPMPPDEVDDVDEGVVPFRPGDVERPGAVLSPGAGDRPGAVAVPERPDEVLDDVPGEVRPVPPVALQSTVFFILPVALS